MAYCTRQDLEDRHGVEPLAILADRDGDGAEDAGAVAGALADAEAMIGAAVAERWPDCIGQTSRLLTLLAVDLTLDRLARGPARTDEIAEAGAAARASLKQIAAGGLRPCDAPATPSSSGASATAAASRMTRTGLGRVL